MLTVGFLPCKARGDSIRCGDKICRALVRKFSFCLIALALLLVGCSSQRVMMPTPNVYLKPDYDVFSTLNPSLKTTDLDMLFITDRAPEQDDEGNLVYGYDRSGSLAFGRVVVELGEDITWEELVAASRTQRRVKPMALEIREVEELIRSVNTPIPFKEVDGRIVEKPERVAQIKSDYQKRLERTKKRAISNPLNPSVEITDLDDVFGSV